MPPKIQKGQVDWKLGSHGLGDLVRYEDLSTIGGAGDSGSAIDVDPNVVVARDDRPPNMEADPHAKFTSGRPVVSCQRSLGIGGRADGLDGRGENREERVTLGRYFGSAMSRQRIAHKALMVSEKRWEATTQVRQKARASLNVAEKEG